MDILFGTPDGKVLLSKDFIIEDLPRRVDLVPIRGITAMSYQKEAMPDGNTFVQVFSGQNESKYMMPASAVKGFVDALTGLIAES